MSSAETERSYVPVENPADRPRTNRETVRVIMIDHDRTLLFEDSDPGVADARWWMTPGGQIEADETMKQAAVREVAEETGYRLSEDDLRHTDEWVWPVELVELWSLVGEPDRWPVDLGTQEESTVLDIH